MTDGSNAGALDIGYDEIVGLLRRELGRVARNARVFALRARARPALLSPREWALLAQIEAELQDLLQHTLQLELHAEPWTSGRQLGSLVGGLLDGLRGERPLLARLLREAAGHPVAQWREGAPQLQDLWPFFEARTRYLANTLALALDEPAPFPPLVWNPRRREFSS